MKRTYRLEIALSIETERSQEILAEGRKLYLESGGAWDVSQGDRRRCMTVKEAVESIEDALNQFIFAYPEFCNRGIELREVTAYADRAVVNLPDRYTEQAGGPINR
jgi:hypothetical protein